MVVWETPDVPELTFRSAVPADVDSILLFRKEAADRQTERRSHGDRHERVYWSASRRLGLNPLTHDT
jgi:hypothetical protein